MSLPLQGVRVVEVASWTFVPSSGGVLADLGADVIKVEPPGGDPQRALMNMYNREQRGPNPFKETSNRGKRSMTVDLRKPEGRDLVLRLCEDADVFLTSYLPSVRARLGIDVEDVRAVNPKIIYARGSGWGHAGVMRDVGGYDSAAAWATAGVAYRLTPPGAEPAIQPAAFFDLLSGSTLAGAIGTALFQRERTGEATIVDVSLMGVGMWAMSPDIVAAPYVSFLRPDRRDPNNPLVNTYPTGDDRWISLVLLQSDRFWPELCGVVDRPDLLADERFASMAARYEHRHALVDELEATFRKRKLSEWRERMEGFSGVWAPVTSFEELHEHPQVEPNGMLVPLTGADGEEFRVVASPMQFGEHPIRPRWATPEAGQHTEEIILEAGMSWDDITELLDRGVLG